jgi:hypothetical protein
MDASAMLNRKTTPVFSGAMSALWMIVSVSVSETGAAAPLAATNDSFCEVAQYLISNTAQKPRNVVHADYESFKKSKTSIDPFETHQFVTYADADKRSPQRISCKLKTVDHLASRFGAAAAGPVQNTCRDLNHRIARSVFATIPEGARASLKYPLDKIRLEGDVNSLMGSKWVADYQHVWAAPDGRLHVFAKTLHVEYTDWLWRWAPEKFRGVYYCHLIAPEYLRALMLGAAQAPAKAAE